jgi:hypothetical protein
VILHHDEPDDKVQTLNDWLLQRAVGGRTYLYDSVNRSVHENHLYAANTLLEEVMMVFDSDFIPNERADILFERLPVYEPVTVWWVENPFTHEVSGHGAVKAFRRRFMLENYDPSNPDFTSGLANKSLTRFETYKESVGTHGFNWSSFSTWRTAYRQRVKEKLNVVAYEPVIKPIDTSQTFHQDYSDGRVCADYDARQVLSQEQISVRINDYESMRRRYLLQIR